MTHTSSEMISDTGGAGSTSKASLSGLSDMFSIVNHSSHVVCVCGCGWTNSGSESTFPSPNLPNFKTQVVTIPFTVTVLK